MPEIPIIEAEAIANLRALNPGDNDEFLKEIVAIYLEDTPQRIAELEASLAAEEVGTFMRAAHSIKGSSSDLGALRLRAAAETLEHGAKKNGLTGVEAGIATVKLEFAAAESALRIYLDN
jgi:HPt (histidine-containing phosphotransfer) domain-containing protein